jgi:lipoate-protein ligase A
VTGFAVHTFRGDAGEFHGRVLDDDTVPEVWLFDVARPALVLGSTQRAEDVADVAACDRAGVDIVRRRSGGGVVLLEPGRIVWFDVVVPAAHLHAAGVGDDVGASMAWLGWHVASALTDLGVDGVDIHRGGLLACSPWCPLVCFAGLGPGEVLRDGVKLVGVSQRRSRPGARFQCAVHTQWNPDGLAGLLAAHMPAAELPPVAELPSSVAAELPAAIAASLSSA